MEEPLSLDIQDKARLRWETIRSTPQFSGFEGGNLPIFPNRRRPSSIQRHDLPEDFYSDKSRIVFCSSLRRMMQKAQVFSLESNTSVRNRLTHSLEVADIGRTLARQVGRKLEAEGLATATETECMQSIVENACLIHDIGNPPFGHFGEEAIKHWFRNRGAELLAGVDLDDQRALWPQGPSESRINDFLLFDGNPQGFRIVTRLHCERDPFGLNLTDSTLLASIKYPNCGAIAKGALFPKKLGIFSSETDIYKLLCAQNKMLPGRRYFLAYLMELADDICYCLSDIADSFEKRIIGSRDFIAEIKAICGEQKVDIDELLPRKIENFSSDVSIPVARKLINEAAEHFSKNIQNYLDGDAPELSEHLPSGPVLKCLKTFARRFIYTDCEAQRIEIAGSRIVEGLLNHYGRLLELPREEFEYFVDHDEMRKGSGLDTEWRIYKQLSTRMLKVYKNSLRRNSSSTEEWVSRARLIVDYISGLTDHSALLFYQNFMGISL